MKLLRIFLIMVTWPFLQAEIVTCRTVVCSFTILRDLCEQLCEGCVDIQVLTIVPNSVDPHLYQPKPSDSKTLAKADLVITNGLNLEGWIDGMINASGYHGTIVVASAQVKARYLGNLPDPHIWHNPKLILQMIENLTEGLTRAFPSHSATFAKNSTKLKATFKALETMIVELFKSIPQGKRIMLTTHDAFSYFGQVYDVKVLSPQGISTSDDPSAADIKNLINQIRTLKISAIFLENLANPKILNAISLETKKTIKGVLFADTLKDKTNLQDTLMYNATTIVKAMKNSMESDDQ